MKNTPLTRERVLIAALALADASGIEALSMRRLGRELGVEAMSLYNHVKNKDEILDGIVDAVVAEFETPSGETDWKAALRRTAISTHQVLLRHGWASALLMSRTGPGPARLAYMESILETLREAGFSAELTHHAYHVLDSHTVGFTLWAVSFPYTAEELEQVGAAFLGELDVGRFPYLAEHIEGHLDDSFEGSSTFEVGLDLILDGLEKLRDAEAMGV